MRNRYLRLTDVLLLFCFVAGTTMTACSGQFHQPALKATYNKPAKNWESEALPIGNGYKRDLHRDLPTTKCVHSSE